MTSKSRICEICGVRERYRPGFFANFPIDEQRCRSWVQIVGKEDLVYVPIEKLNTIRFICEDHFSPRDFNKKGNRLKKRAYPKLNLSAPPLTNHQLKNFPLRVASQTGLTPTTTEQEVPAAPVAGTSKKRCSTATTQNIIDENIIGPAPSSMEVEEIAGPVASTSKTLVTATKQYIMAQTPHYMEVEESAVEALASTSKTPLATSTAHNIIEKTPTKSHKRSGETVDNNEKRKRTSQEPEKLVPVAEVTELTIQRDPQIPVTVQVQDDLSPRYKKLMEQLKKTKCNLRSLRRSANLIENIESTVLKEIVTSAIKNQKRKPQGRRWTTKNKISALAIFKRSPKTYRYLQHLIPLPSVKTLQNVLQKIPMEPGVNKAVIEHLKKIAVNKIDKDKYCGLVFDEIALKPRLLYDAAADKVEGFQDLGSAESGRSLQLADHALVFMLQGIRAKFKQPIAFYFVKGTISSQKLASLIKEIIRAVDETGFKILATICDQGPTNMGGLKVLKTMSAPHDQTSNYFTCDEKKVYIIYDVPHLFKSIRNNFLNYGELHMSGMKAKWEHFFKVEEKNRHLLYLSKISPIHVQPQYRAKMKIKYAAQMLSNTVAAVLKLSAQAEKDPVQAEEIMQTGTIVHDLDRLFDKTNGPSCPDDVKKGRRENVSNKTDHVQVWAEYRKKLESMKFKKLNGVAAKNVRCIEGYITTLRSLRDIWSEVSRLGFKFLNLRQLNQDALENLFGIIRQHSPTNRNPTCQAFVAALKTSVISGMTAPHNRGANCEKDLKKLLTDFHDQVFDFDTPQKELPLETDNEVSKPDESAENQEFPQLILPEEFEEIESDLTTMEQQPLVYISGYIASIVLKNHSCTSCAKCLKIDDPEDDPVFSYIKLREWWNEKTSLTYPTKSLCRLVEAAKKIFEIDVLPCLHYLNISKLTVTLFMAKCDPSFLNCKEHGDQILNVIYNRLALLLIRRQCQRENQKLSLAEETSADSNKKAQQQGIAK